MADFAPNVHDALGYASDQSGIPLETLHKFARIESGGNPSARTGSHKGLLQLSDGEHRRYGGQNIYDPHDNALAGAYKLRAEGNQFEGKYGRQPSASELYMIHQQGAGGADAHWANPDRPAWQNMHSTGEGQSKGENWSKRAIWGNVPDDLKKQYGNVDNMTSKDFTDMWARKINGSMDSPGPQVPIGTTGGDYEPTGAFSPGKPATAPANEKSFGQKMADNYFGGTGKDGDGASPFDSTLKGISSKLNKAQPSAAQQPDRNDAADANAQFWKGQQRYYPGGAFS